MEEEVRRLNAEYGFGLSEDEIKLVARRAEETERLLRRLYDVDLTHVMPVMGVDKRKGKK